MELLRNLLVWGLAIFVLNTSVAEDYVVVVNKTPVEVRVNKVDKTKIKNPVRWPWVWPEYETVERTVLRPGECVKILWKYARYIIKFDISEEKVVCSLGKCDSDREIHMNGDRIYFVDYKNMKDDYLPYCHVFPKM